MLKNFSFTILDFFDHFRFVKKTPGVLPRIFSGIVNVNILGRPRLRVVEIAVNFACNGRCVFCSAAKMFEAKSEKNKLSVEEYKKIGKTLDKLGVVGIVITGGEPFLRKDLPDIIKALGPENKIISIVTNSLVLDENKIKSVAEAGVNSIEFSLESENEKENDRLRNTKGHYKKVLSGIKLAKKAGLNVCLSPCLSHQNINNFEKYIQFAQKKGAFILLSLAGDVGRWSDKENVVLTENDWEIMENMRKKYRIIRNDFSTNFILKEGCPAGREKLYISPYGDIIPCSFTHLSFGNLRKEPLEKIWKKMSNFPPYKDYFPHCRRTRDRDYANKYLDPLKLKKKLPYPVNKITNY